MLSQEFLIQRGYCCGHGCLMCPYEPKHTKDNTIMAEQWTGKGSNSRVKDKQQYDDNYDKIFNKPIKDKCVMCDEDTLYNKHDHVDFRVGYIEGCGQLCLECYDNIYVKKNKNLYKDNGDGSFTKFTNNSDSH